MDQVKSILVLRAIAPTAETAFDFVRSRGLDASVVEEQPEGWLFRQGEPCACGPEVVCDEDGCRVVRGPICTCHPKSASLEPRNKDALSDCVSAKIRKLVDEGYSQEQAAAIAYDYCGEGEKMDEQHDDDQEEHPSEEEEVREKIGLKAGALWLRGLRAYARAADETVEHPGVTKLARRVTRWGYRAAKKHYPGIDLGYKDSDETGEEEDDEDEEKPSDQEKSVLDAFDSAMQQFLHSTERFSKQLTRTRHKAD